MRTIRSVVIRNFSRWFVGLLVLAVTTGILFMVTSKFFAIREVSIIGDRVDLVIDERLFVKNLLFFPTSRVRENLLKENILLKNITITKKLPHTLIIDVKLRRPIARLARGGQRVLVDEEGVVLGEAQEASHLTEVILEGDEAIRQALTFLDLAAETLVVQQVTILDSQSLRARVNTTDIYFPQSGPLEEKVATLQTLVAGFRIKGTLPKIIDLRFDKPTVMFE